MEMTGMHRLLGPLRRRMATMVGRCILQAVNADTGIQQVQVSILADEPMTDVEHMEPYGYTSNPPAGGEGVLLNVAGRRCAAVAFNIGGRQFRLKGLKGGEVALYTDEGDKFVFERGNTTRLTTKHYIVEAEDDAQILTKNFLVKASAGTVFETPEFVAGGTDGASAEAQLDGSMTASGDLVSNGGAVSLNSHIHQGVAPGDGTTDIPVGGM